MLYLYSTLYLEVRKCSQSDFQKRSKNALTPWQRKLAILEHLDDLEDLYIAEKRLADIRAGRVKTIPLEEVMKEYGMVD